MYFKLPVEKPLMRNRVYYLLKPFIPRKIQIKLRKKIIQIKLQKYKNDWPINEAVKNLPVNWVGWPENKKFALVLTHDVESATGQEKCRQLMLEEAKLNFCSSFNFVPEKYIVSKTLRQELVSNGFEVGIHGLLHDGKLFNSRRIFENRAIKINEYLKQWNAVGFRAPAMHHNLNWIHDLKILYDASTFDFDPFEPQPDGIKTIFPFLIQNHSSNHSYIELPYTLPQDFTIFILMQEQDISIWQKKLDWIASHGGMALLNTHPDYMNFTDEVKKNEEYSAKLYFDFLKYVRLKYNDMYWHALPKQVANYIFSIQK